MKFWLLLIPCALGLVLSGCRGSTDPAISASAQTFLDNGGLQVLSTASAHYARPCFQQLGVGAVPPGQLNSAPEGLLALIEAHHLATVTRSAQGVSITPMAPYLGQWLVGKNIQFFCFGKPVLVRAEVVADAQPITAGAEQPYITPGTPAQATRITFKMTDIPSGGFADDVAAHPEWLIANSMLPADYGKEYTVVGVIPTKTENYTFKP